MHALLFEHKKNLLVNNKKNRRNYTTLTKRLLIFKIIESVDEKNRNRSILNIILKDFYMFKIAKSVDRRNFFFLKLTIYSIILNK